MTIAYAPPAAPMPPPSARVVGPSGELAWRVVGLANLYRLLLPPVLLGLYLLTRPSPTVGGYEAHWFVVVCAAYFALGVLFAFGRRGHWPSRGVLVLSHTLLDTTAVAALLYCSGGAASGLGILLVIPVGAMALLADARGPLP